MVDKYAYSSTKLSDASTRNSDQTDSICEAFLECTDCKPVDLLSYDYLFTPLDTDKEQEIQQVTGKLEELLDRLNDEIPAVSVSDYLNQDKNITLNIGACALRRKRCPRQTV